MENNKSTLTETIKAALVEILKTGNSAPKVYLRVRPAGTVDVSEETSWCCSPDEYYKRVPHTLSLEVLKADRDYSSLSATEVEDCVANTYEAAEEIIGQWDADIEAWIAAGNAGIEAAENAANAR
jgi:hypothetical protein